MLTVKRRYKPKGKGDADVVDTVDPIDMLKSNTTQLVAATRKSEKSETVNRVSASSGDIPPDSAPAGYEAGGRSKLYVCSADFRDGFHPGKVGAGLKGCNIGWGGKEHKVSTYGVLAVK